MIHAPSKKENLVVAKNQELLLFDEEDFNDLTCYSSMSGNSSDSEGLSDSTDDMFYLKEVDFEHPFNADYDDVFQFDNNSDESDDSQDNFDEGFDEYNFNHCLGGMKFKHISNIKKVKRKFKTKRVNPKRRIHHREMKVQQEQVIEKRERIASKPVYVPQAISYAEHSHSGRQPHKNSNSEEAQLQQAISQSITDHHVNQYARECGIEYDLLLALTQRELTAEDYDLLLQLDNTVQKKTLSENILGSLPCYVLTNFECCSCPEMPSVSKGDMCTTCMCDFEEGDELRWIPKCTHIFHKDCIDNWLNNHSTCCPICRIEVNS